MPLKRKNSSNGQEAAVGQFPYQASMRSNANAHFCGASIINRRWVVCAGKFYKFLFFLLLKFIIISYNSAHCTTNRLLINTNIVVGAHHRINGGTTHAAERIVNHPNYSSITLANDISMV